MRRWLGVALAGCCLWAGHLRAESLSLNQDLPPGEQYRRLSLVLLIGEGVEEPLLRALVQRTSGQDDASALDPDQLKSPLLRIVDQEGMLAGSAYLFRLALLHGQEVGGRLRQLAELHPAATRAVSPTALREDAILVRTAIAEALEYSGLGAEPGLPEALAAYREKTFALRDLLEFEQFDRELSRLTAEAIASVGSKLDAYQRMFEDETLDETFDRHIRTAERPYAGRGKFSEQAARVTEEIMEGVVMSESQPDP